MMPSLDPLSLPSSNPQNERRLPARFFPDAVQNKAETAKQGRPIYDDVVFINIMRPADPTTDVIRPATEKDKQNYPQEWAAYQQKGEQATTGTPLEQLTFLNRSQIREMQAMNIFNVESLAQLDDRSAFMGWRDLKNKAIAYLALAKDQAIATKWEEQKLAMETHARNQDAKIAALTDQVAQLIAKLSDPSEKPKPGKLSLGAKE